MHCLFLTEESVVYIYIYISLKYYLSYLYLYISFSASLSSLSIQGKSRILGSRDSTATTVGVLPTPNSWPKKRSKRTSRSSVRGNSPLASLPQPSGKTMKREKKNRSIPPHVGDIWLTFWLVLGEFVCSCMQNYQIWSDVSSSTTRGLWILPTPHGLVVSLGKASPRSSYENGKVWLRRVRVRSGKRFVESFFRQWERLYSVKS